MWGVRRGPKVYFLSPFFFLKDSHDPAMQIFKSATLRIFVIPVQPNLLGDPVAVLTKHMKR